MSYLLCSLLGIVFYILYKTVFISMLLYYQYKKRYGNSVIVKFYPYYGITHYIQHSFLNHDDSFYFLKHIIITNPNAKAILFLSGISSMLILISNDWIKLLSQNQTSFSKSKSGFGMKHFFWKGLVQSEGLFWKRQRLFLNSSFHINSIQSKFELMKSSAKEFDNGLSSLDEFQSIDPIKLFQIYSSEVSSNSFFGESIKSLKLDGVNFAVEFLGLINKMMRYRYSTYFIIKKAILGYELATELFNTAYAASLLNQIKQINSNTSAFIKDRYNKLIQNNIKELQPNNFLDLYLKEYHLQITSKEYNQLKEHEKIEFDEIIHQFYTFLVTGTDTTSQLCSMALFELSRNPQFLQRAIKEIKDNNIRFETLQIGDVNKLHFITTVLKESLRLYPVLPYNLARQSQSDIQVGDLFVSKHTLVTPRLVNIDLNKPFFKDHQIFNPDRFVHSDQLDPFDFIPFSSGARNCIGQHMAMLEVKVMFVYLLQNYEIRKIDNYQLKMQSGFIYSPSDKKLFMIRKIKKS